MHTLSIRTGLWLAAVIPFLFEAVDSAQAQNELFKVTTPSDRLIPQYLLPCIHAVEVQSELQLKSDQVEKTEAILQKLDARWWPARNYEADDQRKLVSELESELLQSLAAVLPTESIRRLQQLELQAQGPRAMLRADVAEKLGIPEELQSRLRQFAETAENALQEIQSKTKDTPTQDFSEQIAAIKQKEIRSVFEALNDAQKQALATTLGKRLDLSKLERIYPLAPELIDSQEWAGSPVKLSDLRGKVVLVHFYAFQCINCRNNFERYNEWVEKFRNQDVAVIGIQTPETAAESDPTLVKEAVQRDNLQFPVLIDLKQENWKAWGNTMWPTVYVIDKRGYLRSWWQGELNWQGATGDQQIADLVNRLLKE